MKERKRNASCFLVAMKCFIQFHHFFFLLVVFIGMDQ